VAIIRDISERKRLEDQLHRIQTLEALGQLAGGIAHDFGNVLTSISGFVEMVLRKVPKGDPLRAISGAHTEVLPRRCPVGPQAPPLRQAAALPTGPP